MAPGRVLGPPAARSMDSAATTASSTLVACCSSRCGAPAPGGGGHAAHGTAPHTVVGTCRPPPKSKVAAGQHSTSQPTRCLGARRERLQQLQQLRQGGWLQRLRRQHHCVQQGAAQLRTLLCWAACAAGGARLQGQGQGQGEGLSAGTRRLRAAAAAAWLWSRACSHARPQYRWRLTDAR
jgi:hypothetical protein